MTTALMLGHAVSTWFLTGLIWTIQVVHYPLFAMADRGTYADFAAAHNHRITPLVGPPMVLEALLAVWLAVDPPAGIPRWWTWTGLALVGVVWTSTALLQVPQHGRLAAGFDAQAHAWLVASNWVRTIAWTLRAAIATAMLARLLQTR
jgi:hypothetical protein